MRQIIAGIAWEARWPGVGELSLGVQGTRYSKRIGLPSLPPVATDASPLHYNATLAIEITPRLVAYAGTVTGLEESGIALGNAANGIEAEDGQIRAIEHDLTVTQGLDLAAYQPRFLIEQIVASSRFKAQPPALHRELVQLALANLTVGRSPGGGDGVGMGSGSLARAA